MLTYPARPTSGGSPRLRRFVPGDWIAQPKFNGWRALVHLGGGVSFPTVWNRHGDLLTIKDQFLAALTDLQGRFPLDTYLDCEALERRGSIHGTLVVFDWIFPDEPLLPLEERLRRLRGVMPTLPFMQVPPSDSAVLSDEIPNDSIDAACAAYAEINAHNGETVFEGIVKKRVDSIYPIQTRSPDQRFPYWMKHRFD